MNYDTVALGDVCEFLDSQRVPITESDRKPGPYPYYGANGQQDSIDNYIFDEPLVLLAEDGGYFGSKDRPIAYKVTGKCWVNNHAHVLRPKSNIDVDYLHRVLSYYDVTKYVNGTTRQKLTKGNAENISFPLPPLTEQKRIASLLGRADRLRFVRRTAHDLGDALLQSVFLEMFGEYLKPNYPTTPMEELVRITGGGTPSRDVPEYFEGNIPWLTSKDMRGDYIYDTQEHITEKAIRESATNLVPVGAILLVVKSKILMRRLPIAITKVLLCHGQDIKSIQCSNKVNPHFLVAVLKYNEAKILFQARGANTEGLTLPMLNEIKVPNVPLSLQEEFAGVVRRVEGLRGRMSEAERQVEGLFESLLSESFGGWQQ